MKTWAELLVKFYRQLTPPPVPKGIEVLHPQPNPEVMAVVKKFFEKFYSDDKPRRLMLGINPGRFGAGITGVNFTAPRQLKEDCGIEHPWKNSSELSAEFIYGMISTYGGVDAFYRDYFIGAVCPLGFVRDGKNINYYDDKKLMEMVKPFIASTIAKQMKMGFVSDVCYCIGGEKNFKFLSALNKEYHFFETIIPLSHPRFIMQYRRKKKQEFINEWIHWLKQEAAPPLSMED